MKRKPRHDRVEMEKPLPPIEAAMWLREQARAIERGGTADVRVTIVREWSLP